MPTQITLLVQLFLENELKDFLRRVPKNIIVVIDGAYSEFVTDKSYSDGIDLINNFENIIITRTFSKIFALAGLRLGWAYSSKQIIEILEKVRGPFNVNLFAQKIGSLILEEKSFLKKSVAHNNLWQKKLTKFINSLGLDAKITYANFVLIKIDKKKFNKSVILKLLLKNKILIRDLTSYGLDEFIRVSVGSSKQMNKFLQVLKGIMNNNAVKKINEITIIGPGLIGSSLGLALKKKGISKKIVGIDKSKSNLEDAIKNRSIDEQRTKLDERISNSEIIFICTPVSQIEPLVQKIVPLITDRKTIITDVGSVKKCFSNQTIKMIKGKCRLIPGHPIAGTEFSGAKNAKPDLFKKKWCILTPLTKNESSLSVIKKFGDQLE